MESGNKMYTTRQKQLENYIQQTLKVEVALIMSPINVYYYTGFQTDPHERFFAFVIDATSGETTLFLPTLDKNAAEEQAHVDKLIPISDTDDAYKKFAEIIGSNVTSFVYEKSYVTVAQHEQISQYFSKASFTDIEPLISSVRRKKSSAEITQVKKAINITEAGLKKTIKRIKQGMTETEIKAELEYQLMLLGAEGIAFDTIVLSGEKSALPHGVPGGRKIENSDFLLFDFGVTVNGYHSDLTRTFIIGEGTDKQVDIYETVRLANEKAIAQVNVGQPLKNVDLAARDYISSKQYGAYFTHRIGHGLGLDVHEQPSIHHENEELMEPGLLFTIEPGIYIPDLGGVRIEDNVYINEQGEVEVLTTYPKQLTYISI